jgi:hypothetical protein
MRGTTKRWSAHPELAPAERPDLADRRYGLDRLHERALWGAIEPVCAA